MKKKKKTRGGRIGYIDAMRGMTMILVVFGHVASISISLDDNLSQFFLTFRMPLFFFISGFIGYKAVEKFNFSFYLDRMKLKSFVQIVPVSIFIMVNCILCNENLEHLYNTAWGGWWFTLCLFEMFTIYYLIALVCNRFNTEQFFFPSLFVIAVCGVLHLSLGTRGGVLYSPLIIESLTKYFQFFVLGLFVRKHFKLITIKLLDNDSIVTFLMVSFFAFFMLLQYEDLPIVIYKIIHDVVIRYLGLACVFVFFFTSKEYFEGDAFYSKTLKFIGRRTLDIYLLHNFFLPRLPMLRDFFDCPNQVLLEFFTYLLISLIIIAGCLSVSWVIRRSNTLAYWCFGSKQR